VLIGLVGWLYNVGPTVLRTHLELRNFNGHTLTFYFRVTEWWLGQYRGGLVCKNGKAGTLVPSKQECTLVAASSHMFRTSFRTVLRRMNNE